MPVHRRLLPPLRCLRRVVLGWMALASVEGIWVTAQTMPPPALAEPADTRVIELDEGHIVRDEARGIYGYQS